jgi:hypothetical protein
LQGRILPLKRRDRSRVIRMGCKMGFDRQPIPPIELIIDIAMQVRFVGHSLVHLMTRR